MNGVLPEGIWLHMEERILSDRFEIGPVTYSETEAISVQNTGDGIDKYLESLTKEEIAAVFSDMDAVKSVMERMTATKMAPRSQSYGAWINGRLIGFATLLECSGDIWEMQVEISPEYQHRGYGYEFLSHLLPVLLADPKISCIRYTVIPSNKASVALIEKLGAELQEPETIAEKILLRTYMIRNPQEYEYTGS